MKMNEEKKEERCYNVRFFVKLWDISSKIARKLRTGYEDVVLKLSQVYKHVGEGRELIADNPRETVDLSQQKTKKMLREWMIRLQRIIEFRYITFRIHSVLIAK